MKRAISIGVFLLAVVLSTTLFAQELADNVMFMQAQAGPPADGNVFVQRGITASHGVPGPMVAFGGTEFLMEGRQVKGAPFSADSITETVQVLADGNRITNSSSSKIYRDGEGRTRREVGPGAQAMTLLPFPGKKVGHPEVIISDPVAAVNYMLDVEAKKATKMPAPHIFKAGSMKANTLSHRTGTITIMGSTITMNEPAEQIIVKTTGNGEVKTESLGKQTIEGVEAEGTRVTTTIPAGKIGNQLPIVSTSETWFSPKLERVILSKRHDPRFGDTTFRLANIDQSEPSPSLFQVPSDFTVTDMNTEIQHMRKELERNKPDMERMGKDMEQMRKEMERSMKSLEKPE